MRIALPPVSWLLPVRDGGPWLTESVGSILAEAGSDDEVLVVDDGSRDGAPDRLPSDPRIVLLRSEGRGLVAALELGRRHARHPYLARMDADDVVVPGRRAAQLTLLETRPELAAVGGRARLLDEAGEGMAHYVAWVNGLEDPEKALLVESPLFHPAVMLRAEPVAAVGGYRDGPFPEDYDLWLRLLGAGHHLAAVSEVVLTIRDHGRRLTRTDPRYSRAAFRDLKLAWVARHLLKAGTRVAVWGAGRTGRPWIRWLVAQGIEPIVVDPFQEGSRHGIPIVRPDRLRDLRPSLLLVAVGARGARDEIRTFLRDVLPDAHEGRDWWAVS